MPRDHAITIVVGGDDAGVREAVTRALRSGFRVEETSRRHVLRRAADLSATDVVILDDLPDPDIYERLSRNCSVVLLISYGTDIVRLRDLVALDAPFYYPREEIDHIEGYLRYVVLRLRGHASFARYVRANRRVDRPLWRLWVRFLFILSWGTALCAYVRLTTRLHVVGVRHVLEAAKERRSVLLVGNHVRELEGLVTMTTWIYPRLLFSRYFEPRIVANASVYTRGRLGRLVAYLILLYLIVPRFGLCQLGLLKFILNMKTRPGLFVIYPEGTPGDRADNARPNRPGLGFVAYHADAVIIPMYARGQDEVFPRNFSFPRPFKRVSVTLGAPIDIDRLREKPASVGTFEEISDQIFRKLDALKGPSARASGETGRGDEPNQDPAPAEQSGADGIDSARQTDLEERGAGDRTDRRSRNGE